MNYEWLDSALAYSLPILSLVGVIIGSYLMYGGIWKLTSHGLGFRLATAMYGFLCILVSLLCLLVTAQMLLIGA